MTDNLNHDYTRDQNVLVQKRAGAGKLPGVIVTVNSDGSYGVRIGTGRAARIIQCRKIELSAVAS